MTNRKTFKGGYSASSVVKEAGFMVQEHFIKEKLSDVESYPILAIPHRNINLEAAQHFGIRSTVSELDGRTITASYFPYHNQEGKITGYKKRDWTLMKEDKFHFTVVGNIKVSCQLFGQNVAAHSKGKTKKIYITEGELDCAALYSALIDSVKGTNYEGKLTPAVVSIPLGTGNAVESIAHNEAFVRAFPDIVLAFDNDAATPAEKQNKILKGKEATEAVAGYLLTDNIYTIAYPENLKDCCQCVERGLAKELARIASFGLTKYSPETVCAGTDSDLEELIEPLEVGLMIERFPSLMDKIQGLRTGGELITYAAFSGVGKSTLTREISWELIKHGKKVGIIALEEPIKKSQQGLLALELGVKLPEFRKNPLAIFTKEQIAFARDNVLANGNVFFLDHFGSMKVDKLIQQMRYMHFICGCEHIILDHASMVVAGSESNNERKDLDMLFEEMATFMTVNDVTLHVVVHLKRVDDDTPKTKPGEEPKPYWRTVKKEMLRGSAGIEQMSSTIIVLENEVLPDGRRGRVRSKVEKNREWSFLGVCDTMMQNEQGRLEVVPDDPDWIYQYYENKRLQELGKIPVEVASNQDF